MQKDVKVSAESQTGVTVVELLVVMAIIGIIIAIGVNMMGGVITKQRIRTASGEVQTRLRVAQMLSVVRNKPVTIVFVNTPGINWGQEDSYYACISAPDGTCDEFVNLDSGKTSSLELATNTLHPLVEMYDVNFGADTPNAVTFIPPSGLPRTIMDSTPAMINGVVCFMADAGDEDDDFEDRYEFRRITVDAVVGKATMWTNFKIVNGTAINDNPTCDSQLDDEWKRVF